MKVKCVNCEEIFDESEIIIKGKEGYEEEHCPHCDRYGCLMDWPEIREENNCKIIDR